MDHYPGEFRAFGRQLFTLRLWITRRSQLRKIPLFCETLKECERFK
jgi:hypothetical protein